jgi:aryl-alcohol dehydrogenase-like predicted oxidoreductase
VQIEYSHISRRVEEEIFTTTRELGISITAYDVHAMAQLDSER